MQNGDNIIPANEFLIHLTSGDIEEQDRLFLELLADDRFAATLLGRKIFTTENKAAYRIKISASSLILFKKRFDEIIQYDSLELFEYKEW